MQRSVLTVTAALGATYADLEASGGRILGIETDAEISATALVIAAAATADGTPKPVYSDAGVQLSIPCGTSRYIALWTDDWKGIRKIRVYFDDYTTPVALSAATTLQVVVEAE